jgi:hypothetical protein
MATLDKGVTIRPSSNALITIDSEDRFKSYAQKRAFTATTIQANDPYNFSINTNRAILTGFATRIAVSEVNFPWVIENINRKTCEIIFSYTIAPAPEVVVTLTLAQGFYKPSEIAAALEGLIQALDPALIGFSLDYGIDDRPRFSYETNNLAVLCYFQPMTPNTTAYPYGDNVKQLFDMLGFNVFNSIDSNSGSGNNTLCQAIRYVDICSTQLTQNQAMSDGSSQDIYRDSLCRIYLGGDDGGVPASNTAFCPPGCAPFTIYRMFMNPKYILWNARQNIGAGVLSFAVYDDNGDLLSSNGTQAVLGTVDTSSYGSVDWSLSMLISEN